MNFKKVVVTGAVVRSTETTRRDATQGGKLRKTLAAK
jgi:hypothetical protein